MERLRVRTRPYEPLSIRTTVFLTASSLLCDGVGMPGDLPGRLEGQRDAEHGNEYWLLVSADQAVPESGFCKGEEAQGKPAGSGDEAVGVAASPEVERAPAAADERGYPVDGQVPSSGQMGGEVQQGDDGDED